MRRGPPARFTAEDYRRWHEAGLSIDVIMQQQRVSRTLVQGLRKAAGITAQVPKKPRVAKGTAISRHLPQTERLRGRKRGQVILPDGHEALVENRPLFRGMSYDAGDRRNILVPGINNWKIGARVRKGRWKGMPVYTLTLEERATCPSSCALLSACYGNAMHLARRIRAGSDLESRLRRDVGALAAKHPAGFVVRLHVLGDFYSVPYVRMWEELLAQFRPLHVFGFTARVDADDPIAAAVHDLAERRWRRFAVRRSGHPSDRRTAATVRHAEDAAPGSIICPQQTGRTRACVTCGLCWTTDRRITFLQH